jgi:uncharacterized protein (TIGR02145 family)
MKDKLVIAIVILGVITACNKDDADSIDTNSGTSNTTEIIDGDGNVYESVTIGNQVWLDKNMMSTSFMNGTSIPSTTPYNVNLGVTTKAGPTQWPVSYSESMVPTHGRLYTAAVAISNLKICPNGYRVPTVSDFEILKAYVGVGAIGLKIPNDFATCCNLPFYEGDNSLGFNGRSVGRRTWDGGLRDDSNLGSVEYWTNTLHSSNNDSDGDGAGDGIDAYHIWSLSGIGLGSSRGANDHYQGYCIRCIAE